MSDTISQPRRSWNMSRIRSRDTNPELAVRSMLHRIGFRFSLRRQDLPGRPDIVLVKHHVACFVHGCYWHRHRGCKMAYMPKSRRLFWSAKFKQNVARDNRAICDLRRLGWRVLVVWECQISKSGWISRLERMINRPLRSRHPAKPIRVNR
jgi:DNA mismatch endonuclease (patch repair protein)